MKQELEKLSVSLIGIVMAILASGFNFDKLIGLENNGAGVIETALFGIISLLIILAVIKIFWEKLDL